MRTNTLVIVFILVLAPIAPVVEAQEDFCARVAVGTEIVDPLQLGPTTYSAAEIQDLRFAVLFLEEIRGEHILEMKLSTPQGHHYETLTVPLTTAQSERGEWRRVAGYPRALRVHLVENTVTTEGRFLGTVVETRLPVAGTSIVGAGLYGTWDITLLLDGQEMGCELRNLFVLNP